MRGTSEPEGRSARFETLFRSEYSAVHGYVARRAELDLVDDLVDEVFLVAWRRLDSIPAEPRAWLLAVARNVIGTHIRSARRSRALNVRLAITHIDNSAAPLAPDERDVAAALAALTPKDREALLLVSWEELAPIEAARVLGERPATFRVRLHRARTRFRTALEQPPQAGDAPNTEQHAEAPEIPKEVPNV